MFLFAAFLIFTGALAAAGYYVWSVPQQQQEEILSGRLRELRLTGGTRVRATSDLVRRERHGRFAFLSEFISWVGGLRRLQEYIEQANLKYRATDVFALCVIVAVVVYIALGLAGVSLLILRIGFALALASFPLLYIFQVR